MQGEIENKFLVYREWNIQPREQMRRLLDQMVVIMRNIQLT